MIKYSFIIPVYNCVKYLEDCVNSILNIGIHNMEIVIIDDGSTDGSERLCDRLERLYSSSIKVFHQSNQGVSVARNKGIEVSEGEYIVFVDSDDLIDFQNAQKLISEVESQTDFDLVMCGVTFEYYKKGIVYKKETLSYPYSVCLKPEEWKRRLTELYKINMLSSVWAKIFKRKIIEDNSIRFKNGMIAYEDLDYTIRYMSCCNEILVSCLPVYRYRQPEDEGNASRRLSKIPNLTIIVDQIEESFKCLEDKQKMGDDIEGILLHLYTVLVREKIKHASRQQIVKISGDFRSWYSRHYACSESSNPYISDLINGRITRLIVRRTYSGFRHNIANAVKSTELYKHIKTKR